LHEPVVWDGGRTMYAKSKEEYYFNNFLQSRRQLVILFKNDVTFLSQDEVHLLEQHYNID
jgi:flagellar biosynthesis regulator FlbT